MTRRCVAYAVTRGRRCKAGALDGFDTCLAHTSKKTLLSRLREAVAP